MLTLGILLKLPELAVVQNFIFIDLKDLKVCYKLPLKMQVK